MAPSDPSMNKYNCKDNLTVIFVRFQWEGGYQEAPLPSNHPYAIALAQAASKGTTAAAASKKRRQEAAASVKRQKVDAYERAMAQQNREEEARSKVDTNGAKASESKPKESDKEEKKEEEDDEDGLKLSQAQAAQATSLQVFLCSYEGSFFQEMQRTI
eukprot:g28045.t1